MPTTEGDNSEHQTDDRRRFLKTAGAIGVSGIFAGCLSDGDGADDDATDTEGDDDATDTDVEDTETETDPGGDGEPAEFLILNLDPTDWELGGDREVEVSATIENAGEQTDLQLVEYRLDGEELATKQVQLDGGKEKTITFTEDDVDLSNVETGEHTQSVYTDDDEATGTLTVPSFGPPMPDKEIYEDIVGMHPEDAAETFSVAPEFEIELVASEPLVDSPVDVRWDASGRMWVCEMPDYMPLYPGDGRDGQEPGNWPDGDDDVERDIETLTGWGDSKDNQPPNGKIRVLEDTDGDGVYDEATTFKDELTISRSLALVEADDALLVAHAGRNVGESDLLLCQDTDEDLVSDEEIGVKDSWVNPDNTEHTSNALEYSLQNWLENANSSDRFQVRGSQLRERSDTSSYGQWGLTEDAVGRTYHTTNSNWLSGDEGPRKGENTTSLNDGNDVYPIRPSPGTNRAYGRDDIMSSPTAIAGPGAYYGHLLPPSFLNDVFSVEPKGNCVGHFHLEDQPGSLGINSTHETYDYTAENNPYESEMGSLDEVEFVASYDEVFRPVNVRTGPDGALYIIDMYNGIFQHQFFLTAYLADYYYEHEMWEIDNLEQGAGRIYRVKPEGVELPDPPALDEMGPEELVDELTHENGWVRKTAQRLLVQGQETGAVDALRDLAQDDDALHFGRMHALWALHGLGELDGESVFAVFDDVENSHVISNAIHAGEALYGTDDEDEYVSYLEDFSDHSHDRIATQAQNAL
jgi:hypothetical protein